MTAMPTPRTSEVPLRYALVLFPQWEALDAMGPIECLNTLSHQRSFPYVSDLDLAIIAPTMEPVSTGPLPVDPNPFNRRIAQSVVPTHTFENPPEDIDVLIIPGGFGTGPKALFGGGFEPDVESLVGFVAGVFERVEYVLTICSGSGILARAGLLDGHHATTNKAAWKAITPLGPRTHWIGKARWVVTDNGKIWTSSGVSAGTDCMLALFEEVYGSADDGVSWADKVSAAMEYTRVEDRGDDPWATFHGVQDVPPTE